MRCINREGGRVFLSSSYAGIFDISFALLALFDSRPLFNGLHQTAKNDNR